MLRGGSPHEKMGEVGLERRVVRRRRPPKTCRAARCFGILIPLSFAVQGGSAFQAAPLWASRPQSHECPPTRVHSIASDGLSLGLDDSWRYHPGSWGAPECLPNKPWRPGAPTSAAPPQHQRVAPPPESVRPVREPWKSSREESQVMQALILRAQSDPREMVRVLLSNPSSCNYVNVCTVLHRSARARGGQEVRDMLQARLLPIVAHVLPDCQARQLCNVAWALAKLGLAGEEGGEEALFRGVVGRLGGEGEEDLGLLKECNGGELAMAVWAIVASGGASELGGFLEKAAGPIAEKAEGLSVRDLGLLTWGYATALTNHWRFEVEDVSLELQWLVEPVHALLQRTLRCEEQLQPKDIAMLAWAFGRLAPLDWNGLGPHVDMLCATLASSARQCIRRFTAQDLAELAVGVAHLQYDNANLMMLLAFEATRQLRHFSHRELSNLIWAFAKVFRRPRKFVLAAVEEARRRLPSFSPQELANLVWALTVLEVYDKDLQGEAFALVQRRGDVLDEGELNQLYQVYVLLRLQAPEAVKGVGPRLLRQMEGAWARSKHREKRLTDRQAAVSRVLQSMRVRHVLEAEHDIDILLEDLSIAMEVDGPAHFLRNTGHPMGHTVMKRRLLELLGYSVVSVPHFEWDRIPHWSSMELKRYVQRKCAVADVLHFSKNDVSHLQSFPPYGKKNRFD